MARRFCCLGDGDACAGGGGGGVRLARPIQLRHCRRAALRQRGAALVAGCPLPRIRALFLLCVDFEGLVAVLFEAHVDLVAKLVTKLIEAFIHFLSGVGQFDGHASGVVADDFDTHRESLNLCADLGCKGLVLLPA